MHIFFCNYLSMPMKGCTHRYCFKWLMVLMHRQCNVFLFHVRKSLSFFAKAWENIPLPSCQLVYFIDYWVWRINILFKSSLCFRSISTTISAHKRMYITAYYWTVKVLTCHQCVGYTCFILQIIWQVRYFRKLRFTTGMSNYIAKNP